MNKIDRIISDADGFEWALGKGTFTVRHEDKPGWQGFVCTTKRRGAYRNEEQEHANAVFIAAYDPVHAALVEAALEALEDAVRIHFPNFLKAEEELIEYRKAHGLWGQEED